jgi:hypothetical protein
MPRERWFYAQHHQRRGPVPLKELVESLLAQPQPREALVWRRGFADWTRAEDVPEVERRIAPFLARQEAEAAARQAPAPAPVAVREPMARPARRAAGAGGLLWGGIAAGAAVVGLGAWLLWPKSEPEIPPLPLGGTSADDAPAVVVQRPGGALTPASPPPAPTPAPVAVATPAPTPRPAPTATPTPQPAPVAVADRESDLPGGEVRKLKGVAAWEGETLRLTVYNGTSWRVTELYVTVERFTGDDFKEDPKPLLLVPPGGGVDQGVASILTRVAPDRKKPGLNPLDTGPFEGAAGARPEAFRFRIESARGYAPAR